MGLAKFWMTPNAAVIRKKNRKHSQTAREPRKAKVEPVSRFETLTPRADTRQTTRRWRLELRAEVRPELDMRIRWRGETLLPTSVEVDPAVPGRIILWAEDWAD